MRQLTLLLTGWDALSTVHTGFYLHLLAQDQDVEACCPSAFGPITSLLPALIKLNTLNFDQLKLV